METIRTELLVRRAADNSFASGSRWETAGEYDLAPGAARLQMAIMDARAAGKTWLTLALEPRRYHGRCRACKRPVTALLRERVALGQRDGRPHVSRSPIDLDRPGEDAAVVPCPACATAVRLAPISGKIVPEHRCDSRCTGARGSNCECSCGGANHGADWA